MSTNDKKQKSKPLKEAFVPPKRPKKPPKKKPSKK